MTKKNRLTKNVLFEPALRLQGYLKMYNSVRSKMALTKVFFQDFRSGRGVELDPSPDFFCPSYESIGNNKKRKKLILKDAWGCGSWTRSRTSWETRGTPRSPSTTSSLSTYPKIIGTSASFCTSPPHLYTGYFRKVYRSLQVRMPRNILKYLSIQKLPRKWSHQSIYLSNSQKNIRILF